MFDQLLTEEKRAHLPQTQEIPRKHSLLMHAKAKWAGATGMPQRKRWLFWNASSALALWFSTFSMAFLVIFWSSL
jgi:hypothetical protein